jgi:branched-chain amino acid transport system ATP-binding protein
LASDVPALAVKGLLAGYGPARVLHGVDFAVARGEMVVVIGRNGVGKTTLIETLCGLTTLQGGEIFLHGARVEALPAHRRSRLGLGWVPQEREVFGSLTVEENLAVVARPGVWTIDKLYDLFPRLGARRRNSGIQLSGGEQQMLAVARILRTGARLLLLDEISEGLAPVIVQALGRMIRTLKEKGYTIVMVEQNFRFAAPLADRLYVMEHGRIVESISRAELSAKMQTLHEYLGV